MADIEHKNIIDPNIHEPKNITTATADQVYVADGLGSGSWTSTDQLVLPTGWAYYVDSTYTSGSPLAITAATRTKLTIDGLGATTDITQLPSGVSAFWDTTSNKITPALLDDSYDVRLKFTILPTGAGPYVDIEFDIGGGVGVVAADTRSLVKGAVAAVVTFPVPLFAKSTFISNGCEIYLTPNNNSSVYDIELMVTRTHRGR